MVEVWKGGGGISEPLKTVPWLRPCRVREITFFFVLVYENPLLISSIILLYMVVEHAVIAFTKQNLYIYYLSRSRTATGLTLYFQVPLALCFHYVRIR